MRTPDDIAFHISGAFGAAAASFNNAAFITGQMRQ